MTRKELSDILDYCKANGTSISSRARELGIPRSTVFSARSRYGLGPRPIPKGDKWKEGVFLPLGPDTIIGRQAGSMLGMPSRLSGEGDGGVVSGHLVVDIETQGGTKVRMAGSMDELS